MVFTWEQARKRLAKSLLPFLKEIIMDYEKKYKEALERARVIHKLAKDGSNPIWYNYEEIFPELAESEDERIRNDLMAFLINMKNGDFGCFPSQSLYQRWIAWLEKQKYDRMKPVYDNQDSFESALEKAWKDYNDSGARTVDGCEDNFVECAHAKGFREGYLFGLEEQKEEEGYEIIPVESTLEYKLGFNAGKESEKQKDASKAIEAVERIDKYIDEHLANAHDMKDSNPDKKYYRGWDDALGKMAGILQDVYSGEKQKEQKPVEYLDKEKVFGIMNKLHHLGYSALIPVNSEEYKKIDEITSDVRGLLDYPIEQKPAEWSEEDEMMINSLLEWLNPDKGGTKYSSYAQLAEWREWLKSLLPSWRPSEEQMEALNAIVALGQLSYAGQGQHLIDLYNDLQTKL